RSAAGCNPEDVTIGRDEAVMPKGDIRLPGECASSGVECEELVVSGEVEVAVCDDGLPDILYGLGLPFRGPTLRIESRHLLPVTYVRCTGGQRTEHLFLHDMTRGGVEGVGSCVISGIDPPAHRCDVPEGEGENRIPAELARGGIEGIHALSPRDVYGSP